MIAPLLLDRRGLLATAGMTGLGLLAGCGGARAPQAGVDEGKPRRGGRLRIGTIEPTQAGNLDAHKPVGAGIIRGWAIYSKLWEWTKACEPTGALAESTEIAPDGQSVVIRLHQGLEFHHGKTVSAEDLVYSIRRISDPQLASPYAGLVAAVNRDTIETLDPRTVRLHAHPGKGLVALMDTWISFGGIVPTDYDPVHNVVGCGPFRLKSFKPGQRSTFTRFENYFKPGQPYVDELEIIEFKDQTARAYALQSGQIDLADLVPVEQAQLLRRSPGVKVVTSPTNNVQSLDMNVLHPALSDVRVRQALRLLADRPDLVKRALHGEGTTGNDLYSPHDPTYDHDIAQRAHDPDKAKWLLAQAGHPSLALTITANAAGAPAALVFAEQARKSGLDLKVERLDAASFAVPAPPGRAITTGGIPARGFLASALHYDAPDAIINRTNFHDPRFGALINAALSQPDVEKRKPLVHEAQHIQHDRGSLLIWGFTHVRAAARDTIGGLVAEKTQFGGWRVDEFWRKDA
ncbi:MULTISPECIES: ABC transporter substrate-binding protein [unclassified Sphingomonas]|uniref:ABC transporter substrate-binding protein n=1 Tax=unclassified Sphingomonas TaxID=196159 RepID=UPI000928A163|nr:MULTISPECIES: ABC transporter substrate-binding protein [unclassified Sphingomonas]OJU17083.1 MAG: ABC transporter substrate-binding protein [Sphingomonas sp. 66-10]